MFTESTLFPLCLVLKHNTLILKFSSLCGCYKVSNTKQFRATQCLHLQGQVVESLLHYLTFQMKEMCFITTSVTIYQRTWNHNTSKDPNLHQRLCQKLKLYNTYILSTPWNNLRLIHTRHAAPLPFSDRAMSFVKVRLVARNIRTASPTV
jgi:hypothetical protein